MELNLSTTIRQLISSFLLLILPLLAVLLGVVFNVLNGWFFILCVTWFGMGIIFYGAIS